MHDQGRGEGRVAHASSSQQMGCGQEWVMVGDFASSWKHGVRGVENVASLRLLVRVVDYGESWRYGEIERVWVSQPGETVTSEVAFYDGQRGML